MAFKFRDSRVDLSSFPAATDISRTVSIIALVVPIGALLIVMLLVGRIGLIAAAVVFLAVTFLGVNAVFAFHDPLVLKAIFASLPGFSEEQQKELVKTFMRGRPLGRGEMDRACEAAALLRKAELGLRNGQLSKKTYSEEQARILRAYSVRVIPSKIIG